MSVERMKYVNIVGPIGQFDEFVLQYIVDHDIQLEHALSQLWNFKGLKPFLEENPYDPLIKLLDDANKNMKMKVRACSGDELCALAKKPLDIDETMRYLHSLEEKFRQFQSEQDEKKIELDENRQILKQLIPLKNLQADMDELFHLEYMRIRFGKLPKESFEKMDVVLDGLDVIVVPISSDSRQVWVSYATPAIVSEKIDNVMSSLYFERVWIPGKVTGYPAEAISTMEQAVKRLEKEIAQLNNQYDDAIRNEEESFQQIYSRAVYLHQAFDVRKFAAHTEETFYIAGWMPDKDFRELSAKLEQRGDITFSADEPEKVKGLKPPTILKNNRFFKPFESIVTMYGIPAHNEFDPTVLVAISYILMFGTMFGDVGQGAVLALAGFYMYFKKKSRLGWVLACVGVSSMVFGFLYGSIFGNEHILHAIWKAPMENINQLLILAIGYGAVVILLSIIINITNSIKARDYGRLLFDKNGLAGLVFYGGTLGAVVYIMMNGAQAVSIPLVVGLLVIPLLVMLFKERLEKILPGHNSENGGGSFVEGFFEVFEAVLGFLSNTISFVRVSAFALSHAGLALAVWTLYDMVGGAGKVLVLIIGNLLIIGLEGLIVGIQGLRLQYYEMFSRFFSGDGRAFQPLRIKGRNETE